MQMNSQEMRDFPCCYLELWGYDRTSKWTSDTNSAAMAKDAILWNISRLCHDV